MNRETIQTQGNQSPKPGIEDVLSSKQKEIRFGGSKVEIVESTSVPRRTLGIICQRRTRLVTQLEHGKLGSAIGQKQIEQAVPRARIEHRHTGSAASPREDFIFCIN